MLYYFPKHSWTAFRLNFLNQRASILIDGSHTHYLSKRFIGLTTVSLNSIHDILLCPVGRSGGVPGVQTPTPRGPTYNANAASDALLATTECRTPSDRSWRRRPGGRSSVNGELFQQSYKWEQKNHHFMLSIRFNITLTLMFYKC